MAKPPKAVLAPRHAPDAAIEAFISGQAVREAPSVTPRPAPALPAVALSAPATAAKRTVIRRKDGRELYRTTIYLEPELAQRTSLFAVTQGVDQSELIQAALTEYLSRHSG
jgi:hypothetical protein